MKNKKGMAELLGFAIVIFLVAIAVMAVWKYDLLGSVGGDGDTSSPDKITQCTSDVTPTVTFSAYDEESPGTADTTASLWRRVGDKAWTAVNSGTASPVLLVGETYEFIHGIGTSATTDASYGPYLTHKVACEESKIVQYGVYNDEIETELSATFYNDNHDASAQTFTAGQSKNIYMRLEAGTEQVFGNPFVDDKTPNVFCMNLNSTVWDQPEAVSVYQGIDVDGNNMAGLTLNKIGVPQRQSGEAGHITYCYELPVVTDNGLEVKIRMNADDTTAPDTDETASMYAANWYINSDTGELEFGVETNDGDAVGTDAADTLTLDFT